MPSQQIHIVRLVVLVGGIVGLALAIFVFILQPWKNYNQQIDNLTQQIDDQFFQLQMLGKEQQQVQQRQLLSLPTNPYIARREYDRYLSELLTRSGMVVDFLRGSSAAPEAASPLNRFAKKKEPVFTPVTFQVQARATLVSLAKMLNRFQNTPVLHKIKTLTLEPIESKGGVSQSGQLTVQITIEALIVNDAPPRETVMGVDDRLVWLDGLAGMRGGPAGLALLPWAIGPTGPLAERKLAAERPRYDYDDLLRKNIFQGGTTRPPPPEPPRVVENTGPDMRQFTQLILTTEDDRQAQALLRNRYTNDTTWLRSRRGLNSFWIYDESGEKAVMRGWVLKITQGDVFFHVDGYLYCIHVGETLAEAMEQPADWQDLIGTGMEVDLLLMYLHSWPGIL